MSLDDPVQSGLISPDEALVVLWPLLLVLPRVIQSRALPGLVTTLLHHHCLVRVSASLLHHRLLSFLLHCFSTASSSWLLCRITTASSTCSLHCTTGALCS